MLDCNFMVVFEMRVCGCDGCLLSEKISEISWHNLRLVRLQYHDGSSCVSKILEKKSSESDSSL
jgi:hypothetical protein